MKIMVFLHGTVLMHRSALEHTRLERVEQVLHQDESVQDYAAYVPVGSAVRKLQAWKDQGAEIVYLSSRKALNEIEADTQVLRDHGFPDGPVFFRQGAEEYKDVAERVCPDVLIEDDCESIGGEMEMTYPHIQPGLKVRIRSIVIQEFGGLDHLPNNVSELMA